LKTYFIILARNHEYLDDKINEIEKMGYSYIVVCGEHVNRKNVFYRKPIGKYDAINYAISLVPSDTDIVIFNDVDTKIYNIENAFNMINNNETSLVFVKLVVNKGPQVILNKFLDKIKNYLLVTASGELILIKMDVLKTIAPLKPCKSEDTYIIFKLMENKHKINFCNSTFVITERTTYDKKEELYKRKTVGGIYQALSMTNPPILIKIFYLLLPYISPLLLVSGRKGYYAMKGILLGYVDHIRGDKTGLWNTDYMK